MPKPFGATALYVVPLTFAESNALVARLHRHHLPIYGRARAGHRFSLGVVCGNGLVIGALTVMAPVSRKADHWNTVEVARLTTDGTPNACSFLYAAAARVAKEMGYERIQTYILETEPGTSLRAAGWHEEGRTEGGKWDRPSRRRMTLSPTAPKRRFVRVLNGKRPNWRFDKARDVEGTDRCLIP